MRGPIPTVEVLAEDLPAHSVQTDQRSIYIRVDGRSERGFLTVEPPREKPPGQEPPPVNEPPVKEPPTEDSPPVEPPQDAANRRHVESSPDQTGTRGVTRRREKTTRNSLRDHSWSRPGCRTALPLRSVLGDSWEPILSAASSSIPINSLQPRQPSAGFFFCKCSAYE